MLAEVVIGYFRDEAIDCDLDVALGHGFFLQAETDQRQEQGVFGLKWNVNY